MKRRSRVGRWLVVGLFVLLALAAVGYWHLNQDAAWHEAVAEADRQDPNWRLNDILDTLPRPRDADNSAAVVIRVTGLIPAQWPDQETTTALSRLLPEHPEHLLDEDQLKRVREELTKVQPALAAARTLADMPHGRHPIRYKHDVFSTLLPTVQESRRVSHLLEYDILLRLQENDPEGALVACRAILNAGRSIGDEPLIICQLIRMAIRGDAQRQLERILAQGQVSEPSLAQMQRLLEEEDSHRALLIAARGERGGLPHILQYLESDPEQLIAFYTNIRGEESSTLQSLGYRIMPGRVRADLGHALRLENRWVEIARLPVEKQFAAVRELEAQEKELPPLARGLTPAAGKITQVWLRRHAETRCAVAALAAERYRVKHGRWPDKLDQLVPEFLAKPVLDPFDPGAPGLRLKRTEGGLIFYSVGPDGQDDGGNLEHRTSGQKGKDMGFQLWNADRRRQPPRPRDEATEDK